MIFFLAGTSDARELAVMLQKTGRQVTASVVTENAAAELESAGINAKTGRLDAEEMAAVLLTGYTAVIDASHPFAEEASKNAIEAAEKAGIPYIRYERAGTEIDEHPLVTRVDTYEQAADAAAEKGGVVMLTTGSKTLQVFTKKLLPLADIRLIARMLPRLDNMEKCAALGVQQKNIVAMQGPFTKELDSALYRHYNVKTTVMKESGAIGAVAEKIEAAVSLGIETIVISRPPVDYPNQCETFEEVINTLTRLEEN
ncbi:precorrin-6A reductase [Domibacillus epiphyticus]|uniref:Precorrin-6x reductase n=1 Tax=Domibacillus epiphyticus TaxID=1714355 RepID=A0A1V2A727_9BACI|nr:precorrin-6A reductase [Domibacillus epiphyticus]OMP66747.1 precorrin-6x reductase [Domibacillus epiphyticus]